MDDLPQTPAPERGDYLYPSFWAGLCAGILAGMPLLNEACCMWMAGGGTLAVYFFQLKNEFKLTRPRDGARLGLFTGMFGGVIALIVNAGSQLAIYRGPSKLAEAFRQKMTEAMPPDPQTKEAMEWAMTREGTITMLIAMGLGLCVLFMLLAMAGGAVGVRIMNKDDESS